jgi:cobalt-zinc-cadmium efflux system outer membrane protein
MHICAFAQVSTSIDTLKLSLTQTEQLFLQNNLQLIAQKYEIDIAKAQVIQAKLFPNPTFYFEQNAYNPLRNNFPLDISGNSQFQASFQQLIYLAGKRNKLVKMLSSVSEKSERTFEELIRNLRYDLRVAFLQIYFEQRKIQVYSDKIKIIKDLVNRYESQAAKGNIPLNEVTRLKALLFDLEYEKLTLADNIADLQKLISLYINKDKNIYFIPVINTNVIENSKKVSYKFDSLYTIIQLNRNDLKITELDISINEQNLKYQKSLAVPDLNLQLSYDRYGSFAPNYLGIGVGINLPFFNKNQGNIESARAGIEQSKAMLEFKKLTLKQELAVGIRKLQLADSLMKTFDKSFVNDFERLFTGIIHSYENRNIGLIEFVDYYQTYIESRVRTLDIEFNRVQCMEYLNFILAKTIFDY